MPPQPPTDDTDRFSFDPEGSTLLDAGRVVDRYRVEGVLGRGGMATVYRVRHRTLGSEHALKVLTAPSVDVRRRLLQEGRTQAQLSHANVVSVTDVIDVDGSPGLILELVRGPTLRDVLQSGPLTFDQCRTIGAHILRGVDAAHRIGLVHRDLKPANVLLELAEGGVVAKVSDFGLVKALHGDGVDSTAQTRSGVALGTPAYMAPEQINDPRSVDARADIFSLGALLYEMVTGARAFRGDGLIVLAFQITQGSFTPPRELVPDLPGDLERAILGALVVDPTERVPDARALLAIWLGSTAADGGSVPSQAVDSELLARARDAAEGYPTIALPTPGPSGARGPQREETHLWKPAEVSLAASPPGRRRPWTAIALVAVAVVLAIALLRPAPSTVVVPSQPRLTRLTFEAGTQQFGVLSPDGRQMVYSDGKDLFLQRVGGDRAINLTDTLEPVAREPTFSPDGDRIAFFADGLYVMGATGESPQRLADGGTWPEWSPDGRQIVFGSLPVADYHNRTESGCELRVLDLASGEVRTLVDDVDAVRAEWSPDGERIAFAGLLGTFTVRPDGTDRVKVNVGAWSPRWTADGEGLLLLRRRGSATEVIRLPIHRQTGEASGDPVVLYTMAVGFARQLDRSADGSRWLLTVTDRAPAVREWAFDPVSGTVGSEQPLNIDPGLQPSNPDRSPDGRAIVFASSGEQEDLFVLEDGQLRRLSRGERFTRGAVWHPSGERIAFYGGRRGETGLWSVRPDGGDLRALITDPEAPLMLPAWSPDGTKLVGSAIGLRPYVFDVLEGGAAVGPPTAVGPEEGWVATDWSPDSTRLAVSTGRGPLGVFDLATGTVQRLDVTGYWATFLPDGERLLVGDEALIQVVHIESGQTAPALDLTPARIQRSPPMRLRGEGTRLLVATERADADLWLIELDSTAE